jgi:hypothetical protein
MKSGISTLYSCAACEDDPVSYTKALSLVSFVSENLPD